MSREPLRFFFTLFPPYFSLTVSSLQMEQTTPRVFRSMLCCAQMVARGFVLPHRLATAESWGLRGSKSPSADHSQTWRLERV